LSRRWRDKRKRRIKSKEVASGAPSCPRLMLTVESVEKVGLPFIERCVLSREPGLQEENMVFREGSPDLFYRLVMRINLLTFGTFIGIFNSTIGGII
jgi:hypothetical protein